MTPKIKAIITGATGMVGEGVLHEALLRPAVESVLVINRKPCGVTHPKCFAKTLSRLNPDMTFCYVSGAGSEGYCGAGEGKK